MLTVFMINMYHLYFYLPESHLEKVKTALFKEGAGTFDNYDSCSWETEGKGQFRPLDGSDPFVGDENKVKPVREFKVEMVCHNKQIKAVLNKLIEIHPYETPAYGVYKIKTIKDFV